MPALALLATVAILGAFSWGSFRERVDAYFMFLKRVPAEERMQIMEEKRAAKEEGLLIREGALSADGTVRVDDEFDAELNALTNELNALGQDAGAELDALEAAQ